MCDFDCTRSDMITFAITTFPKRTYLEGQVDYRFVWVHRCGEAMHFMNEWQTIIMRGSTENNGGRGGKHGIQYGNTRRCLGP